MFGRGGCVGGPLLEIIEKDLIQVFHDFLNDKVKEIETLLNVAVYAYKQARMQ